MRYVITGGSGLIGRALAESFIRDGHETIILSRNPDRISRMEGAHIVAWDGQTENGWLGHADGAHGIINLAGENISKRRWSAATKQRILRSRLNAGRAVMAAVEKARNKPAVVIQASGIGYYGTCGSAVIDEYHEPGDDFLAGVAVQWEDSTRPVEEMGVRRVVIRTGLVLSRFGGVLERLRKSAKFHIDGRFGSGEQWFPWIHSVDEVRAIRFLIECDDCSGPFNLVAPQEVTNREFTRLFCSMIGMRLHFSMPLPGMRLVLGEMVDALTASQRARPRRLLEAGFRFEYENISTALEDLLR